MPQQWNSASPLALDALREELFVRVECFLEALDSGRHLELSTLVGRITAAARLVFAAEEKVLRDSGALSLVRHQQEHAQFLSDLDVIADLARRGDVAALSAFHPERWLTAWLAAHGRTDRELPAVTPLPGRLAVA